MSTKDSVIKGENPLAYQSIAKLMWRFSIPAIISFMVNALYNIVDQIFIGQKFAELGMAATNVSFPLVTICTGISLLLGVGGASNFNLSLGRKQNDRAARIAANALSLMLISGTLIAVISLIFLKPLLSLFGATDAIMPYAHIYTLITAIGFPVMIFQSGAAQLIRADGSPRFSMLTVLAGSVFNLIFDPIFLFVFDMGIEGIALATVLGQVLSSSLCLFYLLRGFKSVPLPKAYFVPSFSVIKPICALGAAACVNQFAMTLVQIVKNNIVRHYGALSAYGSEVPLAAVGAISKLTIIFFGIILGIAQGCQPIISYNYGAENFSRVRQTVKNAIVVTSIASILSFLLYQLFPGEIMSIFGNASDEYFDFAVKYLRIFMFMTFINSIQPIATYFFTSIGKASLGMFMSMTRQVIILVPLLIILPVFMGIDGIMFSGPISDGISAALAFIFIFREFNKIKHAV